MLVLIFVMELRMPSLDPILGRSSAWNSARRAREAQLRGRRASVLTSVRGTHGRLIRLSKDR